MEKLDIQNKIKQMGFIIEGEEISDNEIRFYCNNKTNRFFISIKDKEMK
jgi:hypothetical protein